MANILRNVLAVVAGLVIGGAVNMALIMVSPYVVAPPAGADVTTTEGLQKSLHLFQPQHFIMPFLAHALGTLVGAFVAALIAVGNKMRFAFVIGFFFLIGGISAVKMLPAPMWFNITDLALAYLPMAWLGFKLSELVSARNQQG